jgi:uncharacterized protein YndB with AHSA1/START domain
MGHYVQTRDIAAPPDRVFAGYTDPRLMTDWMDLAEIRDATGPLDAAGTRYLMKVRGAWGFRTEVIAAEPPNRIEYRGRGPLGASVHVTATLTPRGTGTHLEQLTEYGIPFGPVGRLLDRLFLQGRPRTIADRELDRLVELVSNPGT